MSRIGKLPIAIPAGVNVVINDHTIEVSGKGGKLTGSFTKDVHVVYNNDDKKVIVKPADDSMKARAMWGLYRSNINNMVHGVTEGFTRRLEITGVGFRAAVDGKILTMFLGYSHEIKILIPAGITVVAEKPTLLAISGANIQVVGQFTAVIKSLRKSDPYKGKGIHLEGEKIRRKDGKKK